MAMTYSADLRSVKQGFDEPTFSDKVDEIINGMGIAVGNQPATRAGIKGMLLLDGNSDSDTTGFGEQVRRLFYYAHQDVMNADGRTVGLSNSDVFDKVSDQIDKFRRTNQGYYQELATAARDIIDGNRGDIVTDAILFPAAVAKSLQDYGSGTSSQGSFDLPPLTDQTTGGGADEIIPDHIRGVAVLYAGLQLEVLGLFKVVDRNVEIFMNGQLPVANDLGGNALNAYYWNSINRMSEGARWMQYSRVLGAKGGEVSGEVGPNTVFDDVFIRFISALSEYDRQQRVGNLIGNGRALSLTAEHVRKAGRDLAANCTLFGYGYTQFAAKRLQQHIQAALNLLKLPDIQQAWGVQSAWQVVERVSAQEFHSTPNVVKYRTMADSGKKVLDIVADKSGAWTSTSDQPLFADPQSDLAVLAAAIAGAQQGGRNVAQPQLGAQPAAAAPAARGSTALTSIRTRRRCSCATPSTGSAVNGIKDQAVADSAQPAETATSPASRP